MDPLIASALISSGANLLGGFLNRGDDRHGSYQPPGALSQGASSLFQNPYLQQLAAGWLSRGPQEEQNRTSMADILQRLQSMYGPGMMTQIGQSRLTFPMGALGYRPGGGQAGGF